MEKQRHLRQPGQAPKSALKARRRRKPIPLQAVGMPSLNRHVPRKPYRRRRRLDVQASLADAAVNGIEGMPHLLPESVLHRFQEPVGYSEQDSGFPSPPNQRSAQAAARLLDNAGALMSLLNRHLLNRAGLFLLASLRSFLLFSVLRWTKHPPDAALPLRQYAYTHMQPGVHVLCICRKSVPLARNVDWM